MYTMGEFFLLPTSRWRHGTMYDLFFLIPVLKTPYSLVHWYSILTFKSSNYVLISNKHARLTGCLCCITWRSVGHSSCRSNMTTVSDIKRWVLTVATSCMEDCIRCCITRFKLHQKQLQMAHDDSSSEAQRRLNSTCHSAGVSELTEELRAVFLFRELLSSQKKKTPADVLHMCNVLNYSMICFTGWGCSQRWSVQSQAFSGYKTKVGVRTGSHDKPDSNILNMIY